MQTRVYFKIETCQIIQKMSFVKGLHEVERDSQADIEGKYKKIMLDSIFSSGNLL